MGRIFITQHFGIIDGTKTSMCSLSCTFFRSCNHYLLDDSLKYTDYEQK